MLTNNGRLFLLPTSQNCSKTFKLFNGNDSAVNDSSTKTIFINATYGGTLILGTGTTAPTKNDYALEQPLENSLTVSVLNKSNASIQTGVKYDDVPSLLYVTALVTNETETDVTVTEIGMTTSTTSSVGYKVLLTRTVLTEPIVMESGKTYQITVAIN